MDTDMSFPFSCPNCSSSWLLSREEIDHISKHLPLVCIECGKEFDILDAVSDIITTDNPFLQYMLRSNYSLAGNSEIILGSVKEVNLPEQFSEIHKVFLTGIGSQPFYCQPAIISNSKFLIFSSGIEGRSYPERNGVSWLVYGNKIGLESPIWRQLLSNAKEYEIMNNFRMEIVELETAFEVFITKYLKPRLKEVFNDKVVESVFDHFRMTRMEDITTVLFEIATGETLKEMLEKANREGLYGKWKSGVFDKRNAILHRGDEVSKEDAKKAFETVFKIIVFLDPTILNHLKTFSLIERKTNHFF